MDDQSGSDEAAPEAIPERPAGRSTSVLLREILAVVLFAGAATLCVVAAFGDVYVLGFGHGAGQYRVRVDAWGTFTGGYGSRDVEHEAPYAWPLLACGVVFLVAGVHRLAASAGSAAAFRTTAAARVAAIAGCGAVAALSVAIYLHADAIIDSQRAQTRTQVADGDAIRADIVTRIGSCPGLALAAAACGVLALLAAGGPGGVTPHSPES